MNILFNIMIFLHVVGAAMVVGIRIANMKSPVVHPRQFDGSILQLITGIVMLGMIPAPRRGHRLGILRQVWIKTLVRNRVCRRRV